MQHASGRGDTAGSGRIIAGMWPAAGDPVRRRWEVAPPVLLAAGGWALVAGVHLFGVWIANLWLLAWVVYGLAWPLAVALTAVAAGVLWRRRGPRWAVPVLALGVLAPAGIVAADWTWVFAHGYYERNRAGFAAVAALARDGDLGAGGYYGDRLPPGLEHLSTNGNAARIRSPGAGTTAVFLPARMGIPDGAAGYAHVIDPPPGATFDCFADPCEVRWSLGDGWYWLGGR